MQKIDWWRDSLALSKDGGKTVDMIKFQAFLEQLIQDLELENVARAEIARQAGADQPQEPVARLTTFLRGAERAPDVVALLESDRVDVAVVEKAYNQLKEFLEQK